MLTDFSGCMGNSGRSVHQYRLLHLVWLSLGITWYPGRCSTEFVIDYLPMETLLLVWLGIQNLRTSLLETLFQMFCGRSGSCGDLCDYVFCDANKLWGKLSTLNFIYSCACDDFSVLFLLILCGINSSMRQGIGRILSLIHKY